MDAYIEFEWNTIRIQLGYEPVQQDIVSIIKLRTIDPPGAPLPMSDTGTYCHYIHPKALEDYSNDPVQYALAWLEHEAKRPA